MIVARPELVLLAGVVLAGATSASAQEPAVPRHEPEIVVSGTGTVTLAPDYAVVRVSVVTRDDLAARAGEANARSMQAVRAALKSLLGVPDAVQTAPAPTSSTAPRRTGQVDVAAVSSGNETNGRTS